MSASFVAPTRGFADKNLSLVRHSSPRPMAHDVLRFLVVYFCERVICLTVGMKELVELRLQRLRITVLRALYEEGHEPDGQSDNAIPGVFYVLEFVLLMIAVNFSTRLACKSARQVPHWFYWHAHWALAVKTTVPTTCTPPFPKILSSRATSRGLKSPH